MFKIFRSFSSNNLRPHAAWILYIKSMAYICIQLNIDFPDSYSYLFIYLTPLLFSQYFMEIFSYEKIVG